MIDMDEEQFEKTLSSLILKFSFERTIIEIVYPFLEKIGVLWLTNNISPAQEHFITHLIRQKLIVAIDALPLAPKTVKRVLLFLPENEIHELGLLFYHYIAKKEGYRTYYLGQTVPYKDLIQVCEHHHPQIIISAFTTVPQANAIGGFLKRMSTDFASAKILISGHVLKKAKVEPLPNVDFFYNALTLREMLVGLK